MKRSGNSQLKDKKRVEDYGEVFTSKKEVNAMLDFVEKETFRIESRFFEPACGTGNFLDEILRRKLNIVIERYKKNQLEFERNALITISSIYGVDILEDNVKECRARLLIIFTEIYKNHFKNNYNDKFLSTVKFILKKNIILGDALALKRKNDNMPIIFSEWAFVNASMVKRRDYTFAHLIEYRPFEGENLFSDLGEEAFIPKTIKEYPLKHFLELADDD
jgi:hypothetical protein